jgi:glucokinase
MTDIMRMVVDIGGTNARFALVSAGSPEPRDEKTVRCADFTSLEHAARRYLQDRGNPVVREAALDVAVDPIGDFIKLTNGPWGFSIEQTRRALGLDRLQVVNDFTALALAVPTLRPDEVQSVGGGTAVTGMPIAVIGPGTGLGVSGLIPASGRFVALQGEGGHTAFSPMNEREAVPKSRQRPSRSSSVWRDRPIYGAPLPLPELVHEPVNESGASERLVKTCPIKAQSTAGVVPPASICNAEWVRLRG